MILYVCLHLTRNQFLKKAQTVSNAWYVKIGCFYLKSIQSLISSIWNITFMYNIYYAHLLLKILLILLVLVVTR